MTVSVPKQPPAPTAEAAAHPLKVICFLFDPNTGGPHIRARAVYQRMTAQGHAVRVVFPRGEGSGPGYIAEAGIPVDQLNIKKPVTPSKPWAFLKFACGLPLTLWRVVRYLKQQRPDVIHVNGAFDIGPALAGRLAGVPVIWHLNDTVFSPRLSRLLGGLVRRTATVVVAAAGRVARHYGVDGHGARTIFAPVDVARFAPRSPLGHPRPAPVLGLLANWNLYKGQDRFVEVIARLRHETPDSAVTGRVMGKFVESQRGYWEPILERIKADGLEAAIDAPGFVADTVQALREIDILLLTSLSEASPICVLEAMSIGIPQVVFDVGGVREMLGEGEEAAGLIVPEGDVAAMVTAVQRLLQDPDLYAAMAANGQARARAHFSLETCVARHEAAYRAAIEKRGRA